MSPHRSNLSRFRSGSLDLDTLALALLELDVAGGSMALSMGGALGNIWMAESKER
jgi:hypothetical protein